MKLYHGTYTDFNAIDLDKCHPFKDFGKGFYLTDIEQQAKEMAKKKARLFNGSPIVIEYEFDEDVLFQGGLKVRKFEKATREWAEFIYNNRSRTIKFRHDYDIVIGPIADDGVAYLLDRYEEKSITLEELARELEFRVLNNQYFFGTQNALKYLKRV